MEADSPSPRQGHAQQAPQSAYDLPQRGDGRLHDIACQSGRQLFHWFPAAAQGRQDIRQDGGSLLLRFRQTFQGVPCQAEISRRPPHCPHRHVTNHFTLNNI